MLSVILHEMTVSFRFGPAELCARRRGGGRVTERLLMLGVSGRMLRDRRLLIWRSCSGLWRSSARCNGVEKVGRHQHRTGEERIGRSQRGENQHSRPTSVIRIEWCESDLSWEMTVSEEEKFPDITLMLRKTLKLTRLFRDSICDRLPKCF